MSLDTAPCAVCGIHDCHGHSSPPTIIIPEPDVVIEIPHLSHFRFGHGRDVVRSRKAELQKVSKQIHQAKEWLSRESKYLEDNCVGHTYKPTGDRDGSSLPWCQDCGAHR